MDYNISRGYILLQGWSLWVHVKMFKTLGKAFQNRISRGLEQGKLSILMFIIRTGAAAGQGEKQAQHNMLYSEFIYIYIKYILLLGR